MLFKNINKITYSGFIFIATSILLFSLYQNNQPDVLMSMIALLLLTIPFVIENFFKVTLPITLKIFTYVFIFTSIIMGNVYSFYGKVANWDNFLHLFSAILITMLGFGLINYLNKHKTNLLVSLLFAFSFTMTFGVLWEFSEYTSDQLFKTDTQRDTIIHNINSTIIDNKDLPRGIKIETIEINNKAWHYGGYIDIGLIDTMTDMFFNAIGAILACGIIYFIPGKRNLFLISRKE